MKQSIKDLIAKGRSEQAMQLMVNAIDDSELKNMLIIHKAKWGDGKKQFMLGIISNGDWSRIQAQVNYALLEIVDELPDENEDVNENKGQASNKINVQGDGNIVIQGVSSGDISINTGLKENIECAKASKSAFISYNHNDSAIAEKLRNELQKKGVDVIVDAYSMVVGESISDFIENSIKDTDITISIVSENSLLSDWVAFETINAFFSAKFNNKKKLIACYKDDSFFLPDFRLKATEKIDTEIAEIEQLIPKYASKNIDTIDLNSQKTRLFDLRNNLGTILNHLKSTRCLDIREEMFEKSFPKILEAF